jgi:hypothetical protein
MSSLIADRPIVFGEMHMGRSWLGHELEDSCPCPKAPCGLVAESQIDPSCPQHALDAAKTMRQAHFVRDCPVPYEPDEMGIHGDDGQVWLPKSRYPKRGDAIKWYAEFAGVPKGEITVRTRWMKHDPQPHESEWWAICARNTPGAFPVWECADRVPRDEGYAQDGFEV